MSWMCHNCKRCVKHDATIFISILCIYYNIKYPYYCHYCDGDQHFVKGLSVANVDVWEAPHDTTRDSEDLGLFIQSKWVDVWMHSVMRRDDALSKLYYHLVLSVQLWRPILFTVKQAKGYIKVYTCALVIWNSRWETEVRRSLSESAGK